MNFRRQSSRCLLVAAAVIFTLLPGSGAGQPPAASILKGVAFIDKTAALAAGADSALEDLLEELLADRSLSIEIRCHVVSSGDEQHDAKLSRDRAQTLRRWWMNRGIAAYRLQVATPQAKPVPAGSAPPAGSRNSAGDRIEILRIQQSYPNAEVPRRAFRFDPVADGQEVLHDFVLVNSGEAPLSISKVRTG